jgi:hypothetical protein
MRKVFGPRYAGLHPDRVDDRVRSSAVRELAHGLRDIVYAAYVDSLDVVAFRHLERL